MWRCPSVKDGAYGTPACELQWGGGTACNYNHLMQRGVSVKRGAIARPSRILLMADDIGLNTGQPAAQTNGTSIMLNCPRCATWLVNGTVWAAPRHNGGSNVCFVDGHVDKRGYARLQANEDDIFGHSNL